MDAQLLEETMSNLTSLSGGDASASSGTILLPQKSVSSSNPTQKKARNLPGNPDPNAEVIALSPRSLLATHRFMCEVCGKGFQRDQNLQLHRRGHNLPWKLKQKMNKEAARKKAYVCPEPTCVHHDPSRALGDLTGIKKHFCRKHGEKKWKCGKCSKRYAVQSDLKAHSKICGTREYRCDCGTIFSRRDSFITHRAFCNTLPDETARSEITGAIYPFFSTSQQVFPESHILMAKHEEESFGIFSSNTIQSWPGTGSSKHVIGSDNATFVNPNTLTFPDQRQPLQNPNRVLLPPLHSSLPSPHMSATTLLQKAAQMGVLMTLPSPPFSTSVLENASRNNQLVASEKDSTVLEHIAAEAFADSVVGGIYGGGPQLHGSTMAPAPAPANDHEGVGKLINLKGTSIAPRYNKELTRDFLGL